ncbi:hypothetical protein OPV22_027970 [Ensete ventricosum]|uniref:Phosphoribulokinase, chloroplastic n=1 Tax=Ensete ventricosum TaxID=4639 RepID=A0AAV8Q547_ENSVE|nr:hypothetical protein OPV22_027970 [Ensete ventricosum]
MRRLTSVFGDAAAPPEGGNPDSNTLIGDTATVICLDDYRSLDRSGRKQKGSHNIGPKGQQLRLHVSASEGCRGRSGRREAHRQPSHWFAGTPRANPTTQAPGLRRTAADVRFHCVSFGNIGFEFLVLCDCIYLDTGSEVEFAWKIQRDMVQGGHSLESIKASIEARKPDSDAYLDPQKQHAGAAVGVLPTQLIADDSEGKVLCVRLIMKEGVEVLQSSLPFRRRIHHLVDTMREEAGTLVPWHRGDVCVDRRAWLTAEPFWVISV